ncbi:hypothetical protein MTR67_008514 [Solanum verrucosum]|uniref:DUF4218 domain-containing protein n=1 Tax=Solanum verrucosum TaxID=315347 RepID=A0AAF0TE03_SOLVR|nr:hypothetical protein MTR67_008514 [Solanum verrucosum]
MVHLYSNGFKPRYFVWSDHGESDGMDGIFYNSMPVDVYNMVALHGQIRVEQVRVEHDRVKHDRVHEMINDAFGVQGGMEPEQYFDEAPNEEARHFYDQLEESSRPLCERSPHSALSVAVRLVNIKSDWNVPNDAMDSMVDLLGELVNLEFNIPKNFYQAKRLVSKLGLTYDRIHCCVNGCMLFYKTDSELENCKFCGHTRYKRTPAGKMVPVQAMHYLPLIPRLKRLYASMRSAPHMRWHREYRRPPGDLSHPSDGEAWKHFDNVYPDFASEPRNVRLGLCSDDFTPFFNNASPYSCWPIFLTPYNLPPEMCMTSPYIFQSCVIPGVLTYDISTKQNFIMCASLMWTINDFPAYGMLSSWMTAGKLACPYCMENSKAFTLKHGRKNTWFDCHRQFLPMDHEFRKMKNAFRKNKVESDPPPPLLTGHQIWERISQLPKVTEASPSRLPGYGVEHNWTKQSIFWELSYWKDNLLRHNLDVMHIEKNYFDNLFNTVMDVKGKTKDNPKARMDIKEYCRRKELWLQELQNGKIVKPKANFSFTLDEKREIIEWVKNLRMPEGYASNLGKRADMNEGKLKGMKSHDCHVFMETLIPIAFSHLPERIWKPITEISLFFKDLCSGKLLESSLDRMEENILVTTTKLEKIFPCGFFDVMEHLPSHLVQEAHLGGPVQTRWMYPFERRNRPNRNDECDIDPLFPPISIFNQNGRGSKKRRKRGFTDMEMQSVVTHILLNCPEIQSYVKDKVDWWVVIKSKPVGRIEIDNVLDVAYQNDVAIVQQQVDVELETTLQHPQHILEEVSDDEILNVEEEISESEENESFDDEKWDDNENETTEEEEWENDGIETSEEE